jgi:WD40 repeat protein
MAFAPDGKTLAVGDGRSIRLRDFASGRDLAPAGGHREGSPIVAIAPSGRIIVTGGFDGALILWDLDSGKERRLDGHAAEVRFISFAPDGALVYSAGRDKTFRVWETATGRELRRLQRPEFGPMLTFSWPAPPWGAISHDGSTMAIRAEKNELLLLDTATGTVRRTLKGLSDCVVHCDFTPDGGTLLGWSTDGKLHRWNTTNGRHQARDFYRLQHEPFGVAFSPDGRLVSFAVQNSAFLPVVDLRTGLEVCRFALEVDEDRMPVCVAFSPDSRTLAWGGPVLVHPDLEEPPSS